LQLYEIFNVLLHPWYEVYGIHLLLIKPPAVGLALGWTRWVEICAFPP
jgi:hypothetical protein